MVAISTPCPHRSTTQQTPRRGITKNAPKPESASSTTTTGFDAEAKAPSQHWQSGVGNRSSEAATKVQAERSRLEQTADKTALTTNYAGLKLDQKVSAQRKQKPGKAANISWDKTTVSKTLAFGAKAGALPSAVKQDAHRAASHLVGPDKNKKPGALDVEGFAQAVSQRIEPDRLNVRQVAQAVGYISLGKTSAERKVRTAHALQTLQTLDKVGANVVGSTLPATNYGLKPAVKNAHLAAHEQVVDGTTAVGNIPVRVKVKMTKQQIGGPRMVAIHKEADGRRRYYEAEDGRRVYINQEFENASQFEQRLQGGIRRDGSPPGKDAGIVWTGPAVARTIAHGRKTKVVNQAIQRDTQRAAATLTGQSRDPKAKAEAVAELDFARAVVERIDPKRIHPHQLKAAHTFINGAKTTGEQRQRIAQALQTFQTLDKVGTPPASPNELLKDVSAGSSELDRFFSRETNKLGLTKTYKALANSVGIPGNQTIRMHDGTLTLMNTKDGRTPKLHHQRPKKKGFFGKMLGVVGTVLSVIPSPIQPIAAVATAAYGAYKAAKSGNILGAVTSGLGALVGAGAAVAGQFSKAAASALQTAGKVIDKAGRVAQAIKSKNPMSLVGLAAGGAAWVAGKLHDGVAKTIDRLKGFADKIKPYTKGLDALRKKNLAGVVAAAGGIAGQQGHDDLAKKLNDSSRVLGVGQRFVAHDVEGAAAGLAGIVRDEMNTRAKAQERARVEAAEAKLDAWRKSEAERIAKLVKDGRYFVGGSSPTHQTQPPELSAPQGSRPDATVAPQRTPAQGRPPGQTSKGVKPNSTPTTHHGFKPQVDGELTVEDDRITGRVDGHLDKKVYGTTPDAQRTDTTLGVSGNVDGGFLRNEQGEVDGFYGKGKLEGTLGRHEDKKDGVDVSFGKAALEGDVLSAPGRWAVGFLASLTGMELKLDRGQDGQYRATLGKVGVNFKTAATEGDGVDRLRFGVGKTAVEVERKKGELNPNSAHDVQFTQFGSLGPKVGLVYDRTDKDGDGVYEYTFGAKAPVLGVVSLGGSFTAEGKTRWHAVKNALTSYLRARYWR